MKLIGKAQATVLVLLVLLAVTSARADVSASLDRDRVALGDTMRLTITATGNEEISSTDLRPLLADFEILQRSTSSNTSISNGQRSHTKQLLIDITPRREGTLKIPPMRVGPSSTNMLLVSVSPAPDATSGGETVLFEAEVDRSSAYVQGQIILTLRVQQAINLESRSITELELDNAFVKPLEQNSFQRTIDGRPWLVHEVRYAIFPEQSGTLEIPAQTFSARESTPRRSFFDIDNGGRQLRRKTDPISIEILPRPDNFPSATWLPARKLVISENWSTAPEQLRAGESATRTITIQGEGLQGAQLPPVLFPPTEGLKYYPDQPAINETETASGLLGARQDSAALVPTRAGTWSIPEIRIPWWDTQAQELRYAVLPAREITVAAADPVSTIPAAPIPTPITDAGAIILTPAAGSEGINRTWMAVAVFSSTGWLLTIIWLIWSRRRPIEADHKTEKNLSEQRAFKQLLAACSGGSSLHARQAIIDWADALFPDTSVVSMDQASRLFGDDALNEELTRLNSSLYSRAGDEWLGTALADIVRTLRKRQIESRSRADDALTLYPAAGREALV